MIAGKLINNFQEEIAEKKFVCKKHGPYIGRISKMMFLGKERSFDPPCPICEYEEKALEMEKEAYLKKQSEEALENQQKEKMREMNIGEKFFNESFDTFNAYTEELKKQLDICIEFSINPQGRMLVMMGNHGNGKNHLAASVLKRTGGYMYSVFEMELMLKQSYKGLINEWDLYQKLCTAPMLVFNEIGRHKAGDWEMQFMSYIINKRYENIKPLILISNKLLIDDCEYYIGNDVVSRISEVGEIMMFTGKDYRIKKRIQGG